MTAYRLHFERANLTAVEIVKSKKLGEPRFITASFSMQVTNLDDIRLKKELGGGPFFDIGVYCVNAMRYLFRQEPTEVHAISATNEDDQRFASVPEMVSVMLRFPDARLAQFTCSFGAADTSWFEIVGTKGKLRLDPAFEYAQELVMQTTIDDKHKTRAFPKRDQFGPELLYFSECVLTGADPEPSGWEGLADVRVIAALLESIERGAPIQLDEFERAQRPNLGQEIRRSAVKRPELVRAKSPSS
jgi:glucose-fructose oxidoreductase